MISLTAKKLIKRMFNNEKATPRKMQEWAYKTSKKGKNLLIVSSTGSGKTEAAYLAAQNWDRTIYALPMTTLATSLHERLNTYEKRLTGKSWALQHSLDSGDPRLKNDHSVTTIDQVLSGFFGFGRESFIRGKNMMRSNLILDEVQLFNPESALMSLLELLNHSTNKPFNNNFCIMTATFPSSLRNYLERNFDLEIYVEKEASTKKNVQIDWADSMPTNKIKENEDKQIIVCNTQKQQVGLYEELTQNGVDKERIIVLNSRLFAEDRRKSEEKVMKYFGKNSDRNNMILLSTQIVEAGMDISADTLYSYEAPVDSLIQREGRTCRWGGNGRFIVIKQDRMANGSHPVYDNKLVENTTRIIKSHIGELFTWQNQLEWIDTVLNPLYEKILSPMNLKYYKMTKLKNGSSKDLIRNMQSINAIPIDNYPNGSLSDFSKSSIALPAYLIDEGLMLERTEIIKTNQAQIGDTLLVDASNWEYDGCGLRKGKGMTPNQNENIHLEDAIEYDDYVEETLEEHLKETAKQMKELIKKENIINSKTKEYDVHKIGLLHDIGKATKGWQKMIRYSKKGNQGNSNILYAHRPWEARPNYSTKGRYHSLIATKLLKGQLTELEEQVIMGHHGRVFDITGKKLIKTDWEKETNNLLNEFAFKPVPLKTDSYSFSNKEVINPSSKNWGLFVYLTGTLMEADRKAIKAVKRKRQPQNIFLLNSYGNSPFVYLSIDKTTKMC